MATTEKNNVIVELYDLALTERKDDRFGRVVTTKSLTEDDLINIAVAQRTDLNANTLRSSLLILRDIAMKEVANGASVRFGLGFYNLTVEGVFIGDNANWVASEHSLEINSTPVAEFRDTVHQTAVQVRGLAASGIAINSILDKSSGKVNSKLTPGGGAVITGSRIKIDGDGPGVGISLINQGTKVVTTVLKNALMLNDPSKIIFVIPAGLPEGDYQLSICTQFSTANNLLKEPRTVFSDYILSVVL